MGLLDNNILMTIPKTESKTLFDKIISGKHTIDCDKYKCVYLFLTPFESPSTINILGTNYDGSSTTSKLIDIKNLSNVISEKINNILNTSTIEIPLGYTTVLMVNTTLFKRLSIEKINNEVGSLSCTYYCNNDTFEVNSNAVYKTKLLSGNVVINGNNSKVYCSNINNNCIQYKLILHQDCISPLIVYADSNNITKECFCSEFNSYLGEQKISWKQGEYNIYVPIEANLTSGFYISMPDTTLKTLYYFERNIDFSLFNNTYTYLRGWTGKIGNAFFVEFPKDKKYVEITIYSNEENKGKGITPYVAKQAINRGDTISIKTAEKKLCKLDGTISTNAIILSDTIEKWYMNIETLGWLSFGINDATISNITIELRYIDEVNDIIKKALGDYIEENVHTDVQVNVDINHVYKINNKDIIRLFENDKLLVARDTNEKHLVATFRNIFVWSNDTYIDISINGIDGEKKTIALNSENFPNLIAGSKIERIAIMPWSRNATNVYEGMQWRMNIITQYSQIYHNFPSRSSTNDGSYINGDEYKFDESVIWELPERFTPVNSKDNPLINITNGKYRYFPGLNESAYEFHPAINTDNGYGNGGFPAYTTKQNEKGENIIFTRWCQYERINYQTNSFSFMAGFADHPKLCMMGTYKSNSERQTRICVFITNDGGRNWYTRYEFGSNGFMIDGDDKQIKDVNGKNVGLSGAALTNNPIVLNQNIISVGSDIFSLHTRYQYIPSETYKEIDNTKKFKWGNALNVTSIIKNDLGHIIVNGDFSSLHNGEIVAFSKNSNLETDFDWIVNEGFNEINCGNGVVFKVKLLSSTQIQLCADFHNPHNNLYVRHIHSIDRCKDGYMIGTGEFYPQGWIFYVPVYESDSYTRKYPWDTINFIRLNSTPHSIMRILGAYLRQDTDNTVYVGIDNEFTKITNATLPEGRSVSIRRSSNGLWKGKLIDFDNQNNFKCVFPSDEVCYLYREINGIMIYVGQQGHIGVSSDNGNTWTECRITQNILSGNRPHGNVNMSTDGFIVIDNIIIKVKS